MPSMDMLKQMQSGRDLLHNFRQLLTPQVIGHRTGLIEHPKRWSVSHQNICPPRDFVPVSAYRCATLDVECPVVERRLDW
jgi:hypothetical protein